MTTPNTERHFMSIRRFCIGYGIRGNSNRFDYNLPSMAKQATRRKDPTSALHDFHKYTQRERALPAEAYIVREVYSWHKDSRREDVRMAYELPGGENPNVKEVRQKKPDAPSTMFSDQQIQDESKYARARMAHR